jgi:hypothetical protein
MACVLHLFGFARKVARVEQVSNRDGSRHRLVKQLHAFGHQFLYNARGPCDVSARARKARDEAVFHRIDSDT